MKFLNFGMNQIFAVAYTPHSGNQLQSTELVKLPYLVSIEKVLLILLFVILIKPLLKTQKDPQLEKQRIDILKLSTILGGLALIVHFYRLVSGH